MLVSVFVVYTKVETFRVAVIGAPRTGGGRGKELVEGLGPSSRRSSDRSSSPREAKSRAFDGVSVSGRACQCGGLARRLRALGLSQ